MLTVGDLREILDGLAGDVTDDLEVRLEDAEGQVIAIRDVVVGPVYVYSNYDGFYVDQEDFKLFGSDEYDLEEYQEDLDNSEPMLVLRSA